MPIPDWLAQHIVLVLLLVVALAVLGRLIRLLVLAAALAVLVASLPWIVHGQIPPWAEEGGQTVARWTATLASWVIDTARTAGHR